ncbi:hypothetical protein [Mycobacterium sp. MS1601]|uniref:hypothetical protein n=1 Tax=Mycobacterium sp. MS1601 TaxID=1936029 RepID=UPI0012F76211|nr:hypothetical protein [Mycobacterium sp. MS1601]
MDVAARSWLATGVAFVGAGAVAFAPITPSNPVPELRVTTPIAVSAPPVELAAVDWPYILSLPIVRQMVVNWAENWVVYLGGFAQAGIGLAESLIAIPGVTVEIIEQLVALDFVGHSTRSPRRSAIPSWPSASRCWTPGSGVIRRPCWWMWH